MIYSCPAGVCSSRRRHPANAVNNLGSTSAIHYSNPLSPTYLDTAIVSLALACDLLDLYFSSSSTTLLHPASPHMLGSVFRKTSFLHPSGPRQCQPALLASILWVAAQTSDAAPLTTSPSARAVICQSLLDLTLRLLKPLVHVPSHLPRTATDLSFTSLSLGSSGAAMPGPVSLDPMVIESGRLDEIVAYIHLATIVSANEHKGASLSWWNSAWFLARELKLGQEFPPDQLHCGHVNTFEDNNYHGCEELGSQENREERRRIWWLLYIVDHHLALCYNRPLSMLNVEGQGLLQPIDDMVWQRGVHAEVCNMPGYRRESTAMGNPAWFECRGHDIFGYFLPLMTILGEIVDLHHTRNRSRSGLGVRTADDYDRQVEEIRRHIGIYEQSLARFREIHSATQVGAIAVDDSGDLERSGVASNRYRRENSSTHSTQRANESIEVEIQTRIVAAYGNQIMHVLHILLAGNWDPVGLLDNHNQWVSSQAFAAAARHAVLAADGISQILKYVRFGGRVYALFLRHSPLAGVIFAAPSS